MIDKGGASLYTGIVDDYEGETVLLLVGNPEGFLQLATTIELRQAGSLSQLGWVRPVRGDVHLAYCESCSVDRRDIDVYWRLCDAAVRRFPEQLRALAESGKSGHAYLDCPSGESGMQVIASKGEYGSTRIFGCGFSG